MVAHPGRFRRLAVAVAVATSTAYLGACTSTEPTPTTTTTTVSPAQRLGVIKATVDKATYVQMRLTSRDVADDAQGVLAATGVGAHPPAFKGVVTARVKGIQADIDIIAVGGKVYAKLPLLPGMREVSPKDLGAPDPATLFSPDKGITSLLTATKSPAFGEPTRSGSEVLATIHGTLAGQRIVDIFWTGDPAADFGVTYGYVEDSGELRTVELTGPFFGSTISSYQLTLDQYGQKVDIVAP